MKYTYGEVGTHSSAHHSLILSHWTLNWKIKLIRNISATSPQ